MSTTMAVVENATTIIPAVLHPLPIILSVLTSRTLTNRTYSKIEDNKPIDDILPPTHVTYNNDVFGVATNQKLSATVTSSFTSLIVNSSSTPTTDVPSRLVPNDADSATLAKITALLVITAVVLVISYRFVVRLFLGYTDRKDDVYADGLSDEEEDSAVVKRLPERCIEIT